MKSCILKSWLVLSVFCCLILSTPVYACTLFAVNGDEWVKGGGTLINKNRDWKPEPQYTQLVFPSGKYAYMGIYSAPTHGIRGGINEKGLVVFTASASSIPTKQRRAMPYTKGGTIIPMLTECSSVAEALDKVELLMGPQFIMLGDKNEIAYIEVAPGGVHSVKRIKNGELHHTNHYLEPELLWANYSQPSESSLTRYERIGELLNTGKKQFTLDDFISFSNDQHDGDDNSIWRIGSKPTATQTLAVMSIYLPKAGSPTVYMKIRENIDEQGQEKISMIQTDKLFQR